MNWEIVFDQYGDRVRRFYVPGGWLYQVELQNYTVKPSGYSSESTTETGWHPPVFVPDVMP